MRGPVAIGVLFALFSCVKSQLSEIELKAYPLDPAHGLFQEEVENDVKLQLYYKPKELVLSQQLNGLQDQVQIEKIKMDLDSLDFFLFRMSRNGHEVENDFASDPASMDKVVNYLSYGIGDRIRMVSHEDTLSMVDFSYARTFGTGAATNILLAFKSNLKSSSGKFHLYFDDTFLGTGISRFNFEVADVKKIPTLKNRLI